MSFSWIRYSCRYEFYFYYFKMMFDFKKTYLSIYNIFAIINWRTKNILRRCRFKGMNLKN